MQAINTYVYIKQPGYRSCVNKKCVDPPNLRPTLRLTKLATAHISRGGISHCTPFSIFALLKSQSKSIPKFNIGSLTRRSAKTWGK